MCQRLPLNRVLYCDVGSVVCPGSTLIVIGGVIEVLLVVAWIDFSSDGFRGDRSGSSCVSQDNLPYLSVRCLRQTIGASFHAGRYHAASRQGQGSSSVTLSLAALIPDRIPPGGTSNSRRTSSCAGSMLSVLIIFHHHRCRFHCCYCYPRHPRISLFRCHRFHYSVGL